MEEFFEDAKKSESYRESREYIRIKNEKERKKNGEKLKELLGGPEQIVEAVKSEETRVANEKQRVADEKLRTAQEKQRTTNENARTTNEQTRLTQEETRATNEDTRKANEEQRVSNHNAMNESVKRWSLLMQDWIQAEEERNLSEKTRKELFTKMKKEFDELMKTLGENPVANLTLVVQELTQATNKHFKSLVVEGNNLVGIREDNTELEIPLDLDRYATVKALEELESLLTSTKTQLEMKIGKKADKTELDYKVGKEDVKVIKDGEDEPSLSDGQILIICEVE